MSATSSGWPGRRSSPGPRAPTGPATAFANPLAPPRLTARSGGSRGSGTPVPVRLDWIRDRALHRRVVFPALGWDACRVAVWGVPEAAAMVRILRYAAAGLRPERWFSPVMPDARGLHPRYRRDLHAVVQPGIDLPDGMHRDTLLISSLRPSSALVLLNVSLGDRAVMRERRCGRPLDRPGWTTHLRWVRSAESSRPAGWRCCTASCGEKNRLRRPRRSSCATWSATRCSSVRFRSASSRLSAASFRSCVRARSPAAAVGAMAFDGSGRCALTDTINIGGVSFGPRRSTTCTYEVNRDGTGSLPVTFPGDPGPTPLSFVIVDDRREIRFIRTDLGVASGVARRQSVD